MSDIRDTSFLSGVTTAVASLATTEIPSSAMSFATDPSPSPLLSRNFLSLPFRAFPSGFSLNTLPIQAARLVGLENTASRILGYASNAITESTVAATVQTAGEAAAESVAEAVSQDTGLRIIDIFYAMKRLSGFFSYLTSRWSLACISTALILNRITIYASTRRHLRLRWNRRLLLRITPIILFLVQILSLLRAIRCQTSPDYAVIRFGKSGKRLTAFEYAGSGGFLYKLGSALLSWETDQQSCSAVNMGPPIGPSDIPLGSFSLLWPAFLRLCFSHFIETLSCALQGRPAVTEAGMSIFEHSLAFAEAESMINRSIGLGMLGLYRHSDGDDVGSSDEGVPSFVPHFTKSQILERMNVSPELLLVVMISCCNCLASNILDVLGKQSRFRLLNTALWGLCFMSAVVWGLLGEATSFGGDIIGLKLPTVLIVGFVPHILILLGVLVCMAIYLLALTITAFSLPLTSSERVSLWGRFALAHENMQGAGQIRSIRLNGYEDFYTTLLRIGYSSLTAASEAVFLNEGRRVVARKMTWLEEDRLAELEAFRNKRLPDLRRSYHGQATPESSELANFDFPKIPDEWKSGYSCETRIDKVNNVRSARSQSDPTGIGLFRGAARCYHGIAFFRRIFLLLLIWMGYALNKLLDGLRIHARPQWLKATTGSHKKNGMARENKAQPLDFWILTDSGELELPDGNEFDVEEEMRKRERFNKTTWGSAEERRLDEKLYEWWKVGGCWGEQDHSTDYNPPDTEDTDDTTSVVSMSTDADSEWAEYESDGRRTPTQTDPFPEELSQPDVSVHEQLLDMTSLSRLLDPRDWESKQEARILAAHLAFGQDGRVLTRRAFYQQQERENARVLLSSRFSRPVGKSPPGREKRKPTPEEESEILEKLILSRRAESQTNTNEQTWESGASGLGPNGPPCVVCQTNPRSIITWPCRCLCVCEECRVSLAMNNFGSCVTCRQDVGGFVRLWVP